MMVDRSKDNLTILKNVVSKRKERLEEEIRLEPDKLKRQLYEISIVEVDNFLDLIDTVSKNSMGDLK